MTGIIKHTLLFTGVVSALVACQASSPTHQITQTAKVVPTETQVVAKQSFILFQQGADTWITKADGSNAERIAAGYHPYSWSPDSQHLLLGKGNSLYVAQFDGSQPKLIYEDQGLYQISAGTQWLTNDLVLLETQPDQFDSRLALLNIETNEVKDVGRGSWRILEAVSHTGEFWIASSDDGFEIASLEGRRILLQDVQSHTTQPVFDPNVVILPTNNEVVYSKCSDGACAIYRMSISAPASSPQIIFEWSNQNLWNLSASPNGKYLAFILGEKEILFLNLLTGAIEHRWPWHGLSYPAFYLWSPEARAIVCESSEENTSSSRIVRLDIETGQRQEILIDVNPTALRDWK